MQRIAVIGGGAAGAALVAECLRHSGEIDIAWFVGRRSAGRGIAYATSDWQHLLNVRAANMGLTADDPGGFMRHVKEQHIAATPTDFLPRAIFGDYVEATLARLIADRPAGARMQTLPMEAIAVEKRGGEFVVRSDDEQTLVVNAVVLAVGALPPVPIAEITAESLDGGRYLPDPWQWPYIKQAPQTLVVLGSGLTAVDVILTASSSWPETKIVSLSRHGCLPAVHAPMPGGPHDRQHRLVEGLFEDGSIRRWFGAVREEARASHDWRAVIDGLRPVTVELWRKLDLVQRRRFLRHVRWAWETLRHRMPPQTAETIQALRDSGRLSVIAGRVRRVEGRAPLELTYRSRDDGIERTLLADLVIQATGLQTKVERTTHPLLRQLLRDGLVRVDPLGLGIETDAHGRVTDAEGHAVPRLRAVGTLLRGTLWECTALPEIRTLGAKIARDLLAELSEIEALAEAG